MDQFLERIVQFGHVEIVEIPICIGDNPGCRSGTPIQLSWKRPVRRARLAVNAFEKRRSQQPRARQKDLLLCASEREEMLYRSGYELRDIFQAERDVRRDRGLRLGTLQELQLDKEVGEKDQATMSSLMDIIATVETLSTRIDSSLGIEVGVSSVSSSKSPSLREDDVKKSDTGCKWDQFEEAVAKSSLPPQAPVRRGKPEGALCA